MPDYSKNMEALLSGYTGDPSGSTVSPHAIKTPGGLENSADVRDMLSILVGAGKGGLKPDDQAAVIGRLQNLIGKPTATKLLNQAAIFNQRTDVLGKTAEGRIAQFYDMGSRDPDVDMILKKTKQLGQGPIAGATQTSDATLNSLATGGSGKLSSAPQGNNFDIKSASGGFQ